MTWRVLDNDTIAKRRAKKLEKTIIDAEILEKQPSKNPLDKVIEVEDDYSDLFE